MTLTTPETNAYASNILSLIRQLLGASLWEIYKHFALEILEGSRHSTYLKYASDVLVDLIQNRPAVVLLHNDLALQIHSARDTDLPSLDMPIGVSMEVVESYFEMCHRYFGAGAQVSEEVDANLAYEMDLDLEEVDEAEIARREAIRFLSEDSKLKQERQKAMDGLLNAMTSLGL
ncbi:hypothetical protein BU26DRAFT_569780 [Trematosphaeria pertusa]|uniref:Uncharacterized protein n=1 Tax=Trematosphaeria pertusa TaxID=390896 RepID=A0A6A6I0B0_9PLEO|nr:uncharacterized protein BU26DRAFT_569780 [Trematosphaeria pertusa]KAF2243885.1 hypothetical protein BU26DRAFT_569780 [Trematosphaeria pertusa]